MNYGVIGLFESWERVTTNLKLLTMVLKHSESVKMFNFCESI